MGSEAIRDLMVKTRHERQPLPNFQLFIHDKWPRILTLFGIFALSMVLYWHASQRGLASVNTDMKAHDQSAYMGYAKKMYRTQGNYPGDGARAPLYPALLATQYSPRLSEETFFERGKQLNVILSMALLAGLYLIFLRYLQPFAAINLFLITTFTLFAFKAPYFQPELLYYFVSFCAFLGMLKLIMEPDWRIGVLTGELLGFAHLIKPSVLPAIGIFGMVYIAQWAFRAYANRRHLLSKSYPIPLAILPLAMLERGMGGEVNSCNHHHTTHQSVQYAALTGCCVILMFLLVGAPQFYRNKQTFGSYFYNVNSTFYVWYDSWAEVAQGTRAHGDREGWPDMPADQIPTLATYLHTHTPHDIVQRFRTGLKESKIKHCKEFNYGYCRYVELYSWAALLLGLLVLPIYGIRYFFAGVFCLLYFGAYMLLYAWFVPINGGQRFMLSLFLPFMFLMALILNDPVIRRASIGISPRWRIRWVTLINCYIIALLVPDIYIILTSRIMAFNAGG
ncbi:MAG: hypothetical protein HND46_16155 [Chloroflexi bacterium]|nr:hypothetical protein [Chloroflexota bacterium]NOG64946.1 hypothetical protein [Chloroflexota bacterium]